jgi:hypothetical protein
MRAPLKFLFPAERKQITPDLAAKF